MPTLDQWWWWLIKVLWLGLGIPAAAHAIMYKRDARSSAIWAYLSLTLPVIGPWLYFSLGINRVERKAMKRFGKRSRPFDPRDLPRAEAEAHAVRAVVGHLQDLRNIADAVARMPLLAGNKLVPLHNGEEAYPRMLEAIDGAQRSITLASYIFDRDDVGRRFARALGNAARRGVKVHALLDGIGALGAFSRRGRALMQAGVETAAFYPLGFPLGRARFNLRNHRKILVVDGRLGFSGGMNISTRHLVESGSAHRCEDLHFEVTGPVVSEIQHSFVEDWATGTGRFLEGEAYFPDLVPTGEAICRGISSGPDSDLGNMMWIMAAALATARSRVFLVTPYFVPPSILTWAMIMAALRGVRVVLFLPSKLDLPFMKWAADAYLWQFLQHNIEIYRRPPPFVHTKLMLVDDRWVLLGSANLDPRSLRLNFEFNIEAYDPLLAHNLGAWLEGLIPASHRVTLEEVDSRPWWTKLRDGTIKLFSPYL